MQLYTSKRCRMQVNSYGWIFNGKLLLVVLLLGTLLPVHVQAFTPTTTYLLQQQQQQQQERKTRIQIPSVLSSSTSPSESVNGSNSNKDSVQQQPKPRGLSNQQAKLEMMNSILAQPPSYSEGDTAMMDINNNILPIIDDATSELLDCIVVAADGRKADNIVALYVAHMTTMTTLLVVVSGNSRPQNQAICSAIRTSVSELNEKQQQQQQQQETNNGNDDYDDKEIMTSYSQPSIEGTAESGWMILDYGSIMVHVMTPKSRLFYNVEGKWKQPQPMISTTSSSSTGSSSSSGNGAVTAATTSSSTTTVGPTFVMTTAISLDLSHLLVPNTAAIAPLNMLQQQQQSRALSSTEGEDIDDDDTDGNYETTYQEVDEPEKEEELDPFWT